MKLYSLFYVISRRVWRWILQDSKCKSRGIDIVCVRSLRCQARNGLVWASLLVGWIWPSPLAMLESRFGLSQSCIAPMCSAPMIESVLIDDLLRLILEALRTDLGLARRTLTGRPGPQKMDLANDWAITQRTCGSRNHVDLLMKKAMFALDKRGNMSIQGSVYSHELNSWARLLSSYASFRQTWIDNDQREPASM